MGGRWSSKRHFRSAENTKSSFPLTRKRSLSLNHHFTIGERAYRMMLLVAFFLIQIKYVEAFACEPCNCFQRERVIQCQEIGTEFALHILQNNNLKWIQKVLLHNLQGELDTSVFNDQDRFPVLQYVDMYGMLTSFLKILPIFPVVDFFTTSPNCKKK